jgi:hypothetical protein
VPQRSLRRVDEIVADDDGLAALARLCRRAPARCGTTRVVAIDGRSGAGKSSLADRLADQLAGRLRQVRPGDVSATPLVGTPDSPGTTSDSPGATPDSPGSDPAGDPDSLPGSGPIAAGAVRVVRLDDAYPGWDGLLGVLPWIRRWLLAPLASGWPAGYHRYDWQRGTFAEWHPVEPGGVLVLEGVGAGCLAFSPYLSLLVWVQATDHLRRERAIARDGEQFARQWHRWAGHEQAYLAHDHPRSRAHVVVRSWR